MTGSLLASLPLSSPAPVRAVGSSYVVDSFSEFSTRTVNRAKSSPTSALGPHSARAKEEDEELFRDLFAGESEASVGYKAPAFIPQKPDTRRVPSSTNPRQHFVPVKDSSPQSGLSTPYIPRLKLEELINARPDDDDEDENNGSRRSSQRGSELQQMSEEDDWCLDDRSTEGRSNKTNPRKAQVMTHARGFNSNLTNNSQRSNNSDRLEQDALRFLEKLDLKAVLHTPRPDILSFYLGTTTAPISTSTNSKARDREKKQPGGIKPRNDVILDEPLKKPRVDGAASRLAHMKSTYGTAPLVRKARRETIDRLANPISGHSSTLLALSPKQREKRRTARAPLSPISAAIAVSCRRSSTSKKAKPPGSLLSGLGTHIGDCEIPVPTPATSKRMSVKQQDPLLHKRRSTVDSSIHTRRPATGKRKSKTALGSHSLVARKEALKKKLQSGSELTKRGGVRKIGGSTFLTQRDDEEGVELIEDFIARNRGAAQASLTFRFGTKASRNVVPNLPTRNSATARCRPQPPQARVGVTVSKSTNRGRSTRTSRGLETSSSSTDRKTENSKARVSLARSGSAHEPAKIFQQPRRPQVWHAISNSNHNTPSVRSLTGRPTIPNNVANPRRLKAHPPARTLPSRAPKDPPSAATALLMGSTLLPSSTDSVKSTRRGSKKASSTSKGITTSFDKQSEQPKRKATTARVSRREMLPASRQNYAVRRPTSKL